MHATTPIDAVPTTRRHLNTEPLRTIHARALVLAHTSGEPIEAARRTLALGLLILRAQRREERAIQLAVDEHARRYRRDEAHRRLSEGLGRGWC